MISTFFKQTVALRLFFFFLVSILHKTNKNLVSSYINLTSGNFLAIYDNTNTLGKPLELNVVGIYSCLTIDLIYFITYKLSP